jgi:CO/xanthine dehydrogenase FAD-binding subunit
MKPPLFRYEAPRSLRDAVAVLASDPDAMVLAGGQSLVPAMNFRVAAPSLLVDIQHVEGLKGITIEGNKIVIKAMTRHREVELDARVRQLNPLIAETMQHVAHVPIRNRGTVVGSLCHADPSAEMPLLFVLLDGTITAEGSDGRREIAAADFFQSFLTTSRRQDEIVIEARLQVLPDGAGFAFDEVTRRHGDYALVGLGCVLSLDDTGRVQDIRLAACGISDRPVRLKPAEDALKGKLVNSNELVAAAHASLDAVTQADDMNTSMSYRRRVLSGLIQRLVPIAAARARRGYRQ